MVLAQVRQQVRASSKIDMKKLNNKIKNWATYIFLIIVLISSFLFAYFLPINELFKGIAAIPGVGALCLSLYKSWKDEQLQNKQQDFILGTASHMAEVAYNKHVIFCEEYIERVEKGRQELFREGPSRNSIKIGRELVNIRQKHSPWLTKEIEDNLKPFEMALIKIGAQEGLLETLSVGEQRSKVVEDVYKAFGLVIGQENSLNEEEANIHIDKVIEKIRDILGINILTKLRLNATDLAFKRLND